MTTTLNRKTLLQTLKHSAIGVTRQEVLEQSDSFCFVEGELITFSDHIMTRCDSPIPDLTAAVPVQRLLKLLDKFPDEDVTVSFKNGRLTFSAGKRARSSWLSVQNEITLPYAAVPQPTEWKKVRTGLPNLLLQAARITSSSQALPLATVVHVTSKRVEACDNARAFRAELRTGLSECFIPGASVLKLEGMELKEVSLDENWVHFKTPTHQISLCCQ
ncbi:unnamed protein product, partial [marine sediment metagenome]